VLVGLYVGYYGIYEVRLFDGSGSPNDRLIAAAGRVQGALAGWVYRHGAWPWVLAVAALVSVAALGAVRRKRRRAAGPETSAESATPDALRPQPGPQQHVERC
jgi:hypothetical protein